MTKQFCDRCKKETDFVLRQGLVVVMKVRACETVTLYGPGVKELCEQCMLELATLNYNFMKQPEKS